MGAVPSGRILGRGSGLGRVCRGQTRAAREPGAARARLGRKLGSESRGEGALARVRPARRAPGRTVHADLHAARAQAGGTASGPRPATRCPGCCHPVWQRFARASARASEAASTAKPSAVSIALSTSGSALSATRTSTGRSRNVWEECSETSSSKCSRSATTSTHPTGSSPSALRARSRPSGGAPNGHSSLERLALGRRGGRPRARVVSALQLTTVVAVAVAVPALSVSEYVPGGTSGNEIMRRTTATPDGTKTPNGRARGDPTRRSTHRPSSSPIKRARRSNGGRHDVPLHRFARRGVTASRPPASSWRTARTYASAEAPP